jgi:hypothetical protein
MQFNTETLKLLFFLVAFSILGIWLFFDGGKKWRRKRLIENIPGSKIRSMAMGLVELQGNAIPRVAPVKAPLSQRECVFYKYLIERYEQRGKNSSWVRVAGDTSTSPFYLDDSTGQVLVDPAGADINFAKPDFYFTSGSFGGQGEIPSNLLGFLEQNNIKYHSLFGNYKMRFTEWDVCPNDFIFVLGTAAKNETFASDYKMKLHEILEAVKKDPLQMKKFDSDGDGTVSIEEWQSAVDGIRQRMMEEELTKVDTVKNETNLVVTKGEEETVFIISEKSEKELIKSLFWQALGETVCGGIMATVCLFHLITMLTKLL